MNWNELLETAQAAQFVGRLNLPQDFGAKWTTTEADRKLAWELYTELRTRVTSQPLHYMHGDEATALTSLADFFKLARQLIRSYGHDARATAALTAFVLNRVIRPFTAEWHKRNLAGDLTHEDGRHEFRGHFEKLRKPLREFATLLAVIAEQEKFCKGSESWPLAQDEDAAVDGAAAFKPVPFKVLFSEQVDAQTRQAIAEKERAAIINRRRAAELPVPKEGRPLTDVAGLAISGGGIRSAAFALGAVQELVAHDIMRHFDILSTVSGGGYLGTFLSSYLNSPAKVANGQPTANTRVGLSPTQLPFEKPRVGESSPLRHLRGHSRYLLNGGVGNLLLMIVMALYGFVATAMILLPVLAGALLLVATFLRGRILYCLPGARPSFMQFVLSDNELLGTLLGLLLIIAALALGETLSRWMRWPALLRCLQNAVGWVLVIGVLFVIWRLIPFALCISSKDDLGGKSTSGLLSVAALSGLIMFVQRAMASVATAPMRGKIKRMVSMIVLALFGPLFVVTVFLLLGHYTIVQPMLPLHEGSPHGSPRFDWLWLIFAGLGLYVFFFLNINQSSLHPFYRWKLGEAFAIRRGDTDDAVEPNDTQLLSEMRKYNPQGPYHLLNAALNGPGSTSGSFRGRGTDFFLFSSQYCGSESTGYYPTTEFEKADHNLNLATAMAISGAAAAPVTGVVKLPVRRFLLALLNVRLDYWLPNPGKFRIPVIEQVPGPWYLIRQAMGWMNERTHYINVSDGGHIENLGLYELLRRRCRYIVAIDGECDPNMRCGALIQAARYAQLDFGVEIETNLSRFATTADGSAKFHFTLSRIDYRPLDGETDRLAGQLLYIKLSRTGNEPAGVEHYRLLNPDFPHQSTADQFFDEAQFEAYRSLGQHVTADLFSDELGTDRNVSSLSELFRKLSSALRDPNHL